MKLLKAYQNPQKFKKFVEKWHILEHHATFIMDFIATRMHKMRFFFFIAYSHGRNQLQMEARRSTLVLLFPIPHSKIVNTTRPCHKVWLNYKTRGGDWPISWKHSRLDILKSIESWWKLSQVPQVCCTLLTLDILFSSNHNFHKSSHVLCF